MPLGFPYEQFYESIHPDYSKHDPWSTPSSDHKLSEEQMRRYNEAHDRFDRKMGIIIGLMFIFLMVLCVMCGLS